MSVFGQIAQKVLPNRIFHSLRMLKKPESYFPHELAASLPPELITYNQDGLITVHNCDFINDRDFKRAYQAGERLNSWSGAQIQWRIHVLFWAVTRAVDLEGDFVECGVNRGGFTRSIIEYINFEQITGKNYYLLDTFEGLLEKYISGEERQYGVADYQYEDCYREFKETFKDFENIVIIKGAVPETLNQVKSEKVCFLSIDMNCAEPEIAAAEFFWDKLASGAAIVLDDYGWAKHIVQKRAFDEFAKQRGVPILSLPTGQGIILKP